MEFLLNDYSFDGQFNSIDDFCDWFCLELRGIFDYIIDKQITLYKKSDFYSRKITKNNSFADILRQSNDPVITKIKMYISQMAYQDPYWDFDPKTDLLAEYDCPMKNDLPNCFSEAIERDKIIISSSHSDYSDDVIQYHKNNVDGTLVNILSFKTFLHWVLINDSSEVKYVFEHYKFEQPVRFVQINNKCYAADAINNNNLSVKDKIEVLSHIPDMIESMSNGVKTRFWDKIEDGIFEYRISVSDGREFRLLFFQKNGINFLNGFIKKTQTTPTDQKKLAKTIKRDYINSTL